MSQDDFDIFSNINALDEPPPVKFSDIRVVTDDLENSSQADSILTLDDLDETPDSSERQPLSLSNSNVQEMSKKGQQLMKRYQKKQEVVQRQTQKKLQTQMKVKNPFSHPKRTSTPTGFPKRKRARFHRSMLFGYALSAQARAQAQALSQDSDEDLDEYGGDFYQDSGSFGSGQGSSFQRSVSVSSMELSREIDHEITIKLKWHEDIERIPFRNLQPFEDLFKMLSEREEVSPNQILLLMENKIISSTDTPSSIGYTSVNFISGRIVQESMINAKPTKKVAKKSELQLKIQSDRWKRPIAIEAQKSDTVGNLLQKFALQQNCATEKMYLKFDGDALENEMTLADLDLEGGEMLDCVFVK